ncbi:hypothetical protein BSKO_04925 [Bryopsis sp. KO-2023]|nr:hypothetical protein BSKO_04925 [Bryopsis sp. KO-2023]
MSSTVCQYLSGAQIRSRVEPLFLSIVALNSKFSSVLNSEEHTSTSSKTEAKGETPAEFGRFNTHQLSPDEKATFVNFRPAGVVSLQHLDVISETISENAGVRVRGDTMQSLVPPTPFETTAPPAELESLSRKELPTVPAPPRFSANFTPVNREAYFDEILEGSSFLVGPTEDAVKVSIDVRSDSDDEVELNLQLVKRRPRPDGVRPLMVAPSLSHPLPLQAGHQRSCFHYIFSWCLCPQVNDETQPLPRSLHIIES